MTFLGKINVFEYKDTKFTLVGALYNQLPIKNLYKIISFAKPDIILLQLRPDQILKSVDLNPLNPATKKFSNRNYFAQILHSGTHFFLIQHL